MVPEIWSAPDRVFLSSLVNFCPFTPLTAWKNKINAWRYHHFTQVHQKLWSYAILFLRWRLTHVIVFILGFFFCPFTPLTDQKIKFQKNKSPEISSFYICVPKTMIRWCKFPEIWCMMNRQTDGQTDGWMDGQKKW